MPTRDDASPPPDAPVDPPAIDPTLRAAVVCVAASAAVLAFGALVTFGVSTALGVAAGGVVATVNLMVFARIGKAFLDRRGLTAPWAVIALLKFFLLIGGVWLLLRSGFVSPLALAVGYGALPIGITAGGLFGPRPPDDPTPEPPARRR